MRYGAKTTLGFQTQVFVGDLSAEATLAAFMAAKAPNLIGIYNEAGALVAPAGILEGVKVKVVQFLAEPNHPENLDLKSSATINPIKDAVTAALTDGVKHKVDIDLAGVTIDADHTTFTLQLADTTIGMTPYSRRQFSVEVAATATATDLAAALVASITNTTTDPAASAFDDWANFVVASNVAGVLTIECVNYNEKFDFAYLENLMGAVATTTPYEKRTKGEWLMEAEREGHIFEGARAYNDAFTDEYGRPVDNATDLDFDLTHISYRNSQKSVAAPVAVDYHNSNVLIAVPPAPAP